MITRLPFLLCFFMLIKFSFIFSQQHRDLLQMDYNSLYDKIEQYKSKKNVYPYLEAYLTKAKKENNSTEIITGYKNYIYEVEYSQRLIYADSMIAVAELTKNNEEIGSAILTKGIIYYSEKEHNKALDCYLTANKLIASTNNDYLKFKTQYNIAHVKYYLGFYNEAISLFLKCSDFFQNKNPRAYINCLHSLTLCYTRIGNYQASAEMNKLALDRIKKYQDFSMIPYLTHSAGINDYFRKSYKEGLTKLKSSIPELIKQKDLANLSVAYFYIASIYWDTGKREFAFSYLLKADQIFTDKKYIRPDLRKNYEMIIDYYKGKSDNDSVLIFMTKLLEADKTIETNSKYLSTKITKEYDTVKLIDETQKIKEEAKNEKTMKMGLFVFVLFLLPALIYLLYKNRKLKNSQQDFDLFKKDEPKEDTLGCSKTQRPNIPKELEKELLTKLEKFENNLGFLKKDLKIEKLATGFKTNYKYLSQIINFHKGLSYPDYINDLRISYIMKKLEEDPKLRKYSNNALAGEAGFSSTPSFTNAFKNKTGMSVNFFIDQIK